MILLLIFVSKPLTSRSRRKVQKSNSNCTFYNSSVRGWFYTLIPTGTVWRVDGIWRFDKIFCNFLDFGHRDKYTLYPIIRNGLIRNSAEFLEKFKKWALGRSNLRNASKKLRNGQCSDFQIKKQAISFICMWFKFFLHLLFLSGQHSVLNWILLLLLCF